VKENQIKTISSKNRLINLIIDLLSISLISEIINIALIKSGNEETITLLMDSSIKVIVFVSYYLFMEGGFGKTLGKMVTGTIVVNLDNEQPKGSLLIIRTLIRIIPILNILDALTFLNTNKTGLHDSISSTKLVKSKDYPSIY